MAEELLSSGLLGLRLGRESGCDTGVDQLTRVYSVGVLLLMVVMVTTKQYLGNPVECFCPGQFTASQERFTNAYCWVSTTYYLPSNQPIVPYSLEQSPRVSYYQWVPLFFLLQTFLCQLPAVVWSLLLSRCGLNVPLMFEISTAINKTGSSDDRKANIDKFVELFDRYSTTQRHTKSSCYSRNMKFISRHCFLLGGKAFGNFLCNCYLIYKLLCLAVCLMQVALTDWYLGGRNFYLYGFNVIHGIMENIPWIDAHHFPPVTICEMDIREQSRVHSYVLQCVLSINVFYEKIFVLLWFWWVMVGVVTAVDIIRWFLGIVAWRSSVHFVSKRLIMEKGSSKALIGGFVKSYLRRDGVLLLKLISRNHGDVLIGMLLESMWSCYVPGNKMNVRKVRKRRLEVELVTASHSSTHLI